MRKGKYGAGETSGCLLLSKRPGLTSFEALEGVKQAFATNKVGHTGTLDKFASGLLLVLVGRAVKLSSWFSGMDKQYEGTICFGRETDTLDSEGALVAEGRIPSREEIEAVFPQFQGDLLQAPPAYSAIHVQGLRSSQLARRGTPAALQKRPISVYALELTAYEVPSGKGCAYAQIRVHCSKGTYIRALARDIALAVGSRGHLTALHRTWIAGFQVSQGVDLRADSPEPLLKEALRPLDQSVLEALGIPYIVVSPEAVLPMIQGKPLDGLIDEDTLHPPSRRGAALLYAGVVDETGNLVAIIEKTEKKKNWSYGYVYARP